MKEALLVRVESIRFSSGESGFCVFSFTMDGESCAAAGVLPGISRGARYVLEGEWTVHPRFGRQFSFSSFEEQPPDSLEALEAFLSSGVIKGIGPAVAKALTAHFGEDSLRIIEEEPSRLTEVPGIGRVKAKSIAESYEEHRGYARTVMLLSPFGVSASACMKLFRIYGADAPELIKENPYRLIDEVPGIGFVKADRIAEKLGIPKDSPARICCGIIAAMNEVADDGSTFAYEKEFTEDCARTLDVSREQVSECIFDLVMGGALTEEILGERRTVSLTRAWEAERAVAGDLYRLSRSELSHLSGGAEPVISAEERRSGMELSPRQREAVLGALRNGVFVITGGPGTGKTTIINMILAVLRDAGVKTALTAPTGRAAKRMSQAAGEEAKTIHRLLEAGRSEDSNYAVFGKNRENPLDAGCVIVDEMSMVDIFLMRSLLEALKPGTRLILVGDSDQLPSVGPGNVLKDIIESGLIESVRLTDIFRQAGESRIITNAHAINRGEYPVFNQRDTDSFFMERGSAQELLRLVLELCAERLPRYYGDLDPLSDIQVLTPGKRDVLGSVNLNRELQQVLNPPREGRPELSFGGRVFRLGDKVIQNKNDYSLEWRSTDDFSVGAGVFNGDIGIVSGVDPSMGTLSVDFDEDSRVVYNYETMDEIELAYALTVHKSQGSEFPVVVMPVFTYLPILTNRNLLYTAVTRARRGVVLAGRQAVCNAMVDNNSARVRNSALGIRLARLLELEQ